MSVLSENVWGFGAHGGALASPPGWKLNTLNPLYTKIQPYQCDQNGFSPSLLMRKCHYTVYVQEPSQNTNVQLPTDSQELRDSSHWRNRPSSGHMSPEPLPPSDRTILQHLPSDCIMCLKSGVPLECILRALILQTQFGNRKLQDRMDTEAA